MDIGLHTPVKGSNVFAVLKGALDAGLKLPYSKACFPAEDKLNGKTIAEYRKDEELPKQFEDVKAKIEKEFKR